MSNQESIRAIEAMIENGYAETHVGYHAEYRFWAGDWRRGAYAQIAEPYGGTYRVYGRSYAEVLDHLFQRGFTMPRIDSYLSPQEAAQIKGVALNSLWRLLRDDQRRAAFFPRAIISGEGRRREYRLHPDDVRDWKPRRRAKLAQ